MQKPFPYEHNSASDFERLYISVREKEQRICTDEELLQLPLVGKDHQHYKEWTTRKRSAERLTLYLEDKKRVLNILEVGCGNGWLSAKLADIEHAKVTGIDVNITELNQARRVFKKTNLKFLPIEITALTARDFDIVVFAASLQYFPSLRDILRAALDMLGKNGEIHILDTHFYNRVEIDDAKQRSKQYYAGMGFEEMNAYYFHHAINELEGFNYKILFNPKSFINQLKRNIAPFYWIRISNK